MICTLLVKKLHGAAFKIVEAFLNS